MSESASAVIDPIARTATIGKTAYTFVEYVMLERPPSLAVVAADLEVFGLEKEFVGTVHGHGTIRVASEQGRRGADVLRAIARAYYATPVVLRCQHCRAPLTCVAQGKRELIFACDAHCAHRDGCVPFRSKE